MLAQVVSNSRAPERSDAWHNRCVDESAVVGGRGVRGVRWEHVVRRLAADGEVVWPGRAGR